MSSVGASLTPRSLVDAWESTSIERSEGRGRFPRPLPRGFSETSTSREEVGGGDGALSPGADRRVERRGAGLLTRDGESSSGAITSATEGGTCEVDVTCSTRSLNLDMFHASQGKERTSSCSLAVSGSTAAITD